MKRIFMLSTLFIVAVTLMAQDVIVTTNEQRIDAKVLVISTQEIRYVQSDMPDGPVFVLPVNEVVSIYFESGHVKVFQTTQNAATSVVVQEPSPSILLRSGNTYIYEGVTMKGANYSSFLSKTCQEAFSLYNQGHNLATCGWIFFGIGVGLDLGFSWWLPYSFIPALAFEIACIPTLIVGYKKMHSSVEVFNLSSSNSRKQAYWSVNATNNGIGLAFNF